ncbi:MAG: hypothetical protein PHT33_13655 [bacterium]|nr:hypothetical protein [bacterium]
MGQTVTAVCEADRRRQEALLSVGSGFEDQVAFNRRFKMKNGKVYTHPGKGNPDITGPAGPVDPEVGVLAAWSADGAFLGCVVNYACHGTVMNMGVSADWIYYLDKTISSCMGEEAVTVFLNGACGDVTQVNNLSLEEPEFGERWAEKVGVRVGAEVLKVMATAERGNLSPVGAISKSIKVSRRQPDPDRVRESAVVVRQGLERGRIDTDWTFAKELLLADYMYAEEPEVSVEVQAVQVGPALFLANPAEYFCQMGLDIKDASPFPLTFVVELANGCVGYVPDEEAFTSSGGGYETVLTGYSNLEPAAGGKIAEAAIELAGDLTPGRLPEIRRASAFTGPWDYGVRGPDLA